MGGPRTSDVPTMPRVRFPLWAKLGLLFGGMFGGAIAIYGSYTIQAERQREADRLRQEMVAVGTALAAGIDGDTFRSFHRESDRERPSFQNLVRQLHSVVEHADSVTWAGTNRRDANGHWHWVVEHTNENPYAVGYPIFDGEHERNEALEKGVVYAPDLEDETGVWRTVFVRFDDSSGHPAGLVEIIADADRDVLRDRAATRRILWLMLAAMAASVAVSFLFGRVLAGNLAQLARAARDVAQGDYEARVHIRTHDELGVLAATFNQMVDGLAEREFIRDTFGRFVNPHVVSEILAQRDLSLGGEARQVTVLMSDLRGFTALSAELGPERMVALLNRYLSRMTEVVDSHGGNVSEMLGDGLVILFGAPVARDDDPQRAVRCAVAMLRSLEELNDAEGQALQMGIGIDTGTVIAGNIGSPQHMKYGVVGDAINLAARIENYTVGTQALISAATAAHLQDVHLGPAQEFHPKGRPDAVTCHAVVHIEGLRAPANVDPLYAVGLSARVWRVAGSEVEAGSKDAPVTAVGRRSLELRDLPVQLRDKLKIELSLPGGPVSGLYGTVAKLHDDGSIRVRLTALTPVVREALDQLVREAGEPRPLTTES